MKLSFRSPQKSDGSSFSTPLQTTLSVPVSNEGSRDNPYIINVNVTNPEGNREFDIQEVDKILHNNWARQGFHIRTHIGVHDKKYWNATMYRERPELEDRAILVTGRCRPSVYDEIDEYHRKQYSCQATKTKHRNTAGEIKQDPGRLFKHWLLIFPEGIVLDNVIISGDHRDILMKSIGVKEKKEDNTSCTLFVNWVVALRDGGFRAKASDDDDEEDSDFD